MRLRDMSVSDIKQELRQIRRKLKAIAAKLTRLDAEKAGIIARVFREHIDGNTINILAAGIARRLLPHYPDATMEDLTKWSTLGIAVAMKKFDPLLMEQVDVTLPKNWLCGYLSKKGYYTALDQMRAGVVGRFRNGTDGTCEPPRTVDPRTVDLHELVTTISTTLSGNEKEIFDGRYRHGHSIQEIAKNIGVTIQCVYTIHNRLIRRIRQYLDGGSLQTA